MKSWNIGNTGVRNPMRIQDALKAYAESSLVGKVRNRSGEIALMLYLGQKGLLNNQPGKDPSGSYGRKFRLMFNKMGFTYNDAAKFKDVKQSDLGNLDELTPFGMDFPKADTVPAIQEFFLRALSVRMESLDSGGCFSPLRWTIKVMFALEVRCGRSALGFSEFAAVVQTSNPEKNLNDIVDEILSMRTEREKAPSKKKFDASLYLKCCGGDEKKAATCKDYADMNLRYLRASGLFQSKGKGIEIAADKHLLAKILSEEEQVSRIPDLDRLNELYSGAKLPTDSFEIAKDTLSGLESLLKQREIAYAYSAEDVRTVAGVNAVRHRLENLLSEDDELLFAKKQKYEWREIADYMDLVAKRGGSKQYGDDGEIKVPRDEVSAYLEWSLWRAFLAMNTLCNKPYQVRRFKIDRDFLPVGTAPGNGPDLIAEYSNCSVVIEVTMSDSSRQEAMEGEPVRRHVSDVALQGNKPALGLFIANNVDTNTAETFRIGTWYTKDDKRTRLDIVPLTLKQFRDFFVSLFEAGRAGNGEVVGLIQNCIEGRDKGDAPEWKTWISDGVARAIGARQAGRSRIVDDVEPENRFVQYLPLYSYRAACGRFGDGESGELEGWIEAKGIRGRLSTDMFVVRACGHSMEPRIQDGQYCVFKANPSGTRHGKIVLAQHRELCDPETGGAYSIKEYRSTKTADLESGTWRHERIALHPLNSDYEDIPVVRGDDVKIVGELVDVFD